MYRSEGNWTKLGAIAAVLGVVVAIVGLFVTSKEGATQNLTPHPSPEVTPYLRFKQAPKPLAITTAANVDQSREQDRVTLISPLESGEALELMPDHSYAFVAAVLLDPKNREVVRRKKWAGPGSIRIDRKKTPDNFEVHKLADDKVEIVAYVGPEYFEHAIKGFEEGETITLSTEPWTVEPKLIEIPLDTLSCSNARGRVSSQNDPKVRHHFLADCTVHLGD